MARKTRNDWVEAGIEVLAQQGAHALTIDRLAERLGVTKGSFYHHFKNQADYRDALLANWEERGMAGMPATPTTVAEALATLDRIVEASPVGTDRDRGMAIRFWATQDPLVRAYVERVDAQRLAFAGDVLTVVVGDRDRARFLGGMLYALLLGSGHMLPSADHETMLEFYEEFKRLLVADEGAADTD